MTVSRTDHSVLADALTSHECGEEARHILEVLETEVVTMNVMFLLFIR